MSAINYSSIRQSIHLYVKRKKGKLIYHVTPIHAYIVLCSNKSNKNHSEIDFTRTVEYYTIKDRNTLLNLKRVAVV